MKPKKTAQMSLAIYIIVMVAYTVVVLLALQNKTSVFWLSYGFMMMAFIIQLGSLYLAIKGATMEAMFYGIPLASLSFYYLWAEFFCSTIFILFQKHASFRLVLIIQLLLLAVYAVVAIAALMGKDFTEQVTQDAKQKISALGAIRVDIEMLAQRTAEPELKKMLTHLAETARFADPMSTEAVENVEMRISSSQAELTRLVNMGDIAEATTLCADMERLFLERKKELMLSK